MRRGRCSASFGWTSSSSGCRTHGQCSSGSNSGGCRVSHCDLHCRSALPRATPPGLAVARPRATYMKPHTAQTRKDGALVSGVGKRHSSHDAPRNKIPHTSHMAIHEDSRGDLHTHIQDKQVENKPFQTISNISTPTGGAFCVALPAAYVPAPPPQPAAPRAGAFC